MNSLTGLPKAYIFDFDGVILDSTGVKTEAFRMLFAQYPEYVETFVQYHLAHQGISRFVKIEWFYQKVLKAPLSKEKKVELGEQFSKLVLEKVLQSPFIPGAEQLLRWLCAQGIPCFIATGTPQAEIDFIVEKRQLQKYFKRVTGSPTKKPEIIRAILKDYQLKPEEVVFLGDAVSDYQAAQQTSVPFIAVTTDDMLPFWEKEGIQTFRELDQLIS